MKAETYSYKGKTIKTIPSNRCANCVFFIEPTSCDVDKVAAFKAKDCVYNRKGSVIFVNVPKKLSEKELMKRKFRKFLSDNNAVIEYFRNVADPKCEGKGLKNAFKRESYRWILSAFYWSDAKEGHECWSELHSKWCKLLQAEKRD